MSADTLLAWLELAEECRLETLHDTCLQQLAHCLATSGPYWPQQVGATPSVALVTRHGLPCLAGYGSSKYRALPHGLRPRLWTGGLARLSQPGQPSLR